MAEEKQLTVAELLARNAKEREAQGDSGNLGNAPRRRRRRSLENGGVSVAELTGSLSKVNAAPVQAKHSNVDIDETAPVIPAPKREGDKENAAPAVPVIQGILYTAKTPSADDTTVMETVKDEPVAPSESTEPAEPIESVDFTEPVESAEPADSAEPAESVDSTEPAAPADPVAPADSSDTAVIPAVKDEPEAEKTAAPEPGIDKANADATHADVDSAVTEEEPADVSAAATADDGDEEEEKLNPVSVVLLALVGIVLGAVVFKGFEILWGSLGRVIVAVMALGVTGVTAGIVHALRTERDRTSVILALIVGLLLTFGPLLLV